MRRRGKRGGNREREGGVLLQAAEAMQEAEMSWRTGLAAAMLMALAACGSSKTDRGLSGGAIGAGVGRRGQRRDRR